ADRNTAIPPTTGTGRVWIFRRPSGASTRPSRVASRRADRVNTTPHATPIKARTQSELRADAGTRPPGWASEAILNGARASRESQVREMVLMIIWTAAVHKPGCRLFSANSPVYLAGSALTADSCLAETSIRSATCQRLSNRRPRANRVDGVGELSREI